MKVSLIWRVAIPYVLLLILAITGLGFYYSGFVEQNYLESRKEELISEAKIIAEQVTAQMKTDQSPVGLDALAKRYGQVLTTRITLILPDGTVVGESSRDPLGMELHNDRPEVIAALQGGEGYQIRFSDTVRYRLMYVAVPVRVNGNVAAVVRLADSLAEIQQNVNLLRQTALGVTLVTTLIAILLAILITNQTIRPLRHLTQEVNNFLTYSDIKIFPLKRKDEIGQLSKAFSDLSVQLKNQIEGYKTERIKLEAVLGYITDAIMIVDSDGSVLLINPAAERMFNVYAADAVDRSFVEVVRHHSLVELWRRSVATERQQTLTFETSPDRSFIQAIATPLEKELIGSTLLVYQDLTRVRKLETVRRDFVSNVSHELRTPLASLKALTETLQEGALEDPPAARRFLQRMDTEIDNMTQMVRELLELSRIESGKIPLNLQPVDPCGLIEAAVERMQLQAERAGIEIQNECFEPLPQVRADAERIEQVLVNLMHNAVKFTPQGGKIALGARPELGKVTFFVRDTGVGIAHKDLARIFERFYKADQSRSGGGTGLGLSIARHTIEAHEGRIWAESEPGKGSTFYFSLPENL